jgi:flavorubredoxin
MSKVFEAIPISDRVFWVGAIDWSIRDFHGYLTGRGTTYNAFLIKADRVILIDTVKRPFCDEMLSRIASVVDPSSIDTIVSHHAELDHSGCLPEVTKLFRPDRVLTSKAGIDALAQHFSLDVPVEAVKTGVPTELGDVKLTFHDTRMLHWPESMVSWLEGDGVLFSQDGFGMHLASLERWADEVPRDVVDYETAKYFANILMPFAGPVGKVLGKLAPVIDQTKVIATDHGPLWRKGIEHLLSQYQTWCERKPARKVVITYASMWQSTATMARAIAEGAASTGVKVKLMGLDTSHRSDIATELLDAGALLVGSPNLNGQMYPTVADVLTYLEGLKPKGLLGAAFGSYGWSPAALDQVNAKLQSIKVELVREPLGVKYVPTQSDLLACRDLGREVGERVQGLFANDA